MTKKRVLVVMGGPSQEYEISVKTGMEIVAHMDRTRYDVSVLLIDRRRQFRICDSPDELQEQDYLSPQDSRSFKGPYSPFGAVSVWGRYDICFLALHGEFGEDGIFQGYLETVGVPYTGCGVYASATGMNKTAAKKIFEASGIPTPPYAVYRGEPEKIDAIAARIGLPCFVKCPQSGSSKLMGKAQNKEELRAMLTEYAHYSRTVLVEQFLSGDELSCPVIERDGTPIALTPVYIKPTEKEYFDYEAKYSGASEEIVPPPHSEELIRLIQQTARAAHISLECAVYSRTDVIIQNGIPHVLEVNTLPGLTKESLFPKSYTSRGGSFTDLITEIIETSYVRCTKDSQNDRRKM
ncbi:MAG: D-alanine--D-alanine ligase family protein [Fibrobacterota bacterium]